MKLTKEEIETRIYELENSIWISEETIEEIKNLWKQYAKAE